MDLDFRLRLPQPRGSLGTAAGQPGSSRTGWGPRSPVLTDRRGPPSSGLVLFAARLRCSSTHDTLTLLATAASPQTRSGSRPGRREGAQAGSVTVFPNLNGTRGGKERPLTLCRSLFTILMFCSWWNFGITEDLLKYCIRILSVMSREFFWCLPKFCPKENAPFSSPCSWTLWTN